jgi:hypothetical protein
LTQKGQTQKLLITTDQETHRSNYKDMLIIMTWHLADQTTKNGMNCHALAMLHDLQHLSQQMHTA